MVHFFLHISVQQNVLFYCFVFFGTDQRKETKYPQFIQIFIFLQLLMKQNSNLKEWEKNSFPSLLGRKNPKAAIPNIIFYGMTES